MEQFIEIFSPHLKLNRSNPGGGGGGLGSSHNCGRQIFCKTVQAWTFSCKTVVLTRIVNSINMGNATGYRLKCISPHWPPITMHPQSVVDPRDLPVVITTANLQTTVYTYGFTEYCLYIYRISKCKEHSCSLGLHFFIFHFR